MKIYEMGLPSHYDDEDDCCDCTIWIAIEDGIEIKQIETIDNMYLKEIEVSPDCPDIDFSIIKST